MALNPFYILALSHNCLQQQSVDFFMQNWANDVETIAHQSSGQQEKDSMGHTYVHVAASAGQMKR